MKAWKFLSIPLMLMLVSGMPWSDIFAADANDTVTAESGQHVNVDNVTVSDKRDAVKITANQDGDNNDASANVSGDVDLQTNLDNAKAVNVQGLEGNASAEISGNVSAYSEYNLVGIKAEGSTNSNEGTANVEVGGDVSVRDDCTNGNETYGAILYDNSNLQVNGNVSVESQSIATGIDLHNADATIVKNVTAESPTNTTGIDSYNGNIIVGGDITATGSQSTGLDVWTDKKTTVNVGGGVFANGVGATGVMLETHEDDGSKGNLSAIISNGITAESTESAESNGTTTGLSFCNYGGKLLADITGDVVAKSPNGDSIGIETFRKGAGEPFGDGTSSVLVHGNLTSDGIGIFADTIGEPARINFLVEDTIRAKDVGILLQKSGCTDESPDNIDTSKTNINLTVWKVKPNSRGNVAEWEDAEGERTPAKEFEKNIMYIIYVEQPGDGGFLTVTDSKGKALKRSYGFDVAHEGDKVLLKVTLEKGFKLVAAYNGISQDKTLRKDKNGNYYIIVPKGGGVYLSVELEDSGEHYYSNANSSKNSLYNDDSEQNEGTKTNETDYGTYLSYNHSASESSSAEALKTGDNEKGIPWLMLSVISAGSLLGLKASKKNSLKKLNEEQI